MGDVDGAAVAAELRALRRDAGEGITPELIAKLPTLCRLLGRGDPYLAAGGLQDRLSTAAARGDRDMLALLDSLRRRGDATSRITQAGIKLHVEYRRARDLSDIGITKLAEQIAADADWQVPFMGIVVDVRRREAVVQAFVQCALGFVGYRHPRLLIDDEQVEPGHRLTSDDEWERHDYGPVVLDLRAPQRTIRLRRVGSASVRANVFYTSDNPAVQLRSQLAYLTYAVNLVLAPSPPDPNQLELVDVPRQQLSR